MTTGTASRRGISTLAALAALAALVFLLASVSAVALDNRDKEKVRGVQTRQETRVAE
jgi:predicted porin